MPRYNAVQAKSYEFALGVVGLYRALCSRREYVLSRQLVKSGTGVGSNVEEAIAGQSRADFVSKMAIARKEARESQYWLRILLDSGLVTPTEAEPLKAKAKELVRILTSIILSTRKNTPDDATARRRDENP